MSISINDNVINGRDLVELVEKAKKAEYHRVYSELQDLKDKANYAMQFAKRRGKDAAYDCLLALRNQARDIMDDLDDDFEGIDAFEELLEGASNATGGHPENATIIAASYWEDYVKELVRDLGYINADADNVLVIDWEATANGIANDYTFVELEDGEEFFIR